MDRREYKSKPHHLVTDPRTGEIIKIVHPSDVDVGTPQIPANLRTYGTTTLQDSYTLGNSNVSGSVQSTTLNVLSASFFTGSLNFSGSLNGVGALNFSGSLNSTGSLNHSGSVTVISSNRPTLQITGSNVGIGSGSLTPGGGVGVLFIADAVTNPTSNPTSGSVVYNELGKLRSRDTQGNLLFAGSISKRLSGTFTTTSALGVATHLSFSVEANSLWRFEYRGSVKNSGASGMKYAINAPTGSVVEAQLLSMLGYGGTPQVTTLEFTAINTLSSTVHVSNANVLGPDLIAGTVAVGSTGGQIIIMAASALAGDTTTIQPGAYLYAQRCDNV